MDADPFKHLSNQLDVFVLSAGRVVAARGARGNPGGNNVASRT
jgi:hypothetical protein